MNLYINITKQCFQPACINSQTIASEQINNDDLYTLAINNNIILRNTNILMLWRNKKNINKKQAANIFNISPKTYSMWENTGKMNLQAIVFIQDWYQNLPLSEFNLDTIESVIEKLKAEQK